MRKITAIIFILAVLFAAPITAFAAQLSATAPESVSAGKTLTAELVLDCDTPLSAVHLRVYADEEFSLKNVDLVQSGHIRTYRNDGFAEFICLADESFSSGVLLTLEYTALRSSEAGKHTMTIEMIQVTDTELSDVSITAKPFSVEITKSASSGETTSRSSSKTDPKSPSSSKRTSSYSSGSSSKTTSSRQSSRSSRSSRSSKRSSETDEETTDEPEHSAVYPNREGYLKTTPDKEKYAAAGALAAFGVCGVLFAVYKIGQASASGKNDKDEW